jgi:hypothetical protein
MGKNTSGRAGAAGIGGDDLDRTYGAGAQRFSGRRPIDGESAGLVQHSDVQSAGRFDADLRGILNVTSVPRSRRELRQTAQSLVATLEAAGATLDAAINPEDGSVVLLAPDPNALRALIASRSVALPDFVRIEQFDGIQLTADVYGGRAYNGSAGNGCTTGFTVLRSSDQVRGVSTVGHFDNTGKWSASNTSTYSS